MELKDQSIRECFIHEHNRNFSVIAPAGTGKTTARTRRIANIAVRQSIPPEKLIIVTYTNKAAEELRQRTLWEVKKINGSLNLYNKISAEQSTLLPTNCCENMDILSNVSDCHICPRVDMTLGASMFGFRSNSSFRCRKQKI